MSLILRSRKKDRKSSDKDDDQISSPEEVSEEKGEKQDPMDIDEEVEEAGEPPLSLDQQTVGNGRE